MVRIRDLIWILINNATCQIGFHLIRRGANIDLDTLYLKIGSVKIKGPLVRIGSESDGSYVLVDNLSNVDKVLSAGVGQASDFKKFFLERY